MTYREKRLLFSTLEMLREELRRFPDFINSDWKDVDDYIFSNLDFTAGELEELYAGTGKLIYAGSAIEGFRPIAPTYDELKQILSHPLSAGLLCITKKVPHGEMAGLQVMYESGAQGDIVLTEQDIPTLTEHIGQTAHLVFDGDNRIDVVIDDVSVFHVHKNAASTEMEA